MHLKQPYADNECMPALAWPSCVRSRLSVCPTYIPNDSISWKIIYKLYLPTYFATISS